MSYAKVLGILQTHYNVILIQNALFYSLVCWWEKSGEHSKHCCSEPTDSRGSVIQLLIGVA